MSIWTSAGGSKKDLLVSLTGLLLLAFSQAGWAGVS
jgi:hypothetical protein